MTADEEISFGMDRPPRSPSRLMIGVAVTCLVVGFLAGLRTGEAMEKQNDGRAGVGRLPAPDEPSTVRDEGRPPEEYALRIGESFYQFDDRRTTTAAQFRNRIPSGNEHRPHAGTRFVGLMVETCAHADMDAAYAFSVSALDWELIDADGQRRRPRRTEPETFSRPSYPTRTVAVNPGECVRGWVVWALPENLTAMTAVFTHTSTWWDPQDGASAEWRLA